MTLFALTKAVSIGRALGARGGYRIDGNQEFIGQGLSNIAGSLNRSAVKYEAGARTPLAAVFAGMLLMLVVFFVAPLASYLPKATLAAAFFLVAWGLTESKEAAVHAIFQQLHKSVCVRCEKRIFRESQEVPPPR